MKKEIADMWVAELLSGDYIQGTGQLRSNDDKFCCLGVLCNLHAKMHPELAEFQNIKNMYFSAYGLLPEKVLYWADMKHTDGGYTLNYETYSLSVANDNGATFQEIAQIIRENWEKL